MFTVGQRVIRKIDRSIGTVESVQPFGDDVAVAVRLDSDGEVWSGTEQAWAPATECECAASYLDSSWHSVGCPLDTRDNETMTQTSDYTREAIAEARRIAATLCSWCDEVGTELVGTMDQACHAHFLQWDLAALYADV